MPVATPWEQGALPLQWGVVLAATLAAAAFDLRSRRIPNWLTAPCLIAGLAHAAWMGGWVGLALSAAAAAVVALPTAAAFVLGHGGAGDAKLMAGVGAWLGPVQGLVVAALVALSGIVLALAVILRRRTSDEGSDGQTKTGTLTVPYGVAILAGVCLSATGVWIWHA